MSARGYCGIAGVTEPDEVLAIVAMLNALEHHRSTPIAPQSIALGVLTSGTTLRGEVNRYPRRYPQAGEISRLLSRHRDPRIWNVLHVSVDRRDMCSHWIKEGIRRGSNFVDAVQINHVWPSFDDIERGIEDSSRVEVILQIGPEAFPYDAASFALKEMLSGSTRPMAELDTMLGDLFHQVARYVRPGARVRTLLFDASAGRGHALVPEVAAFLHTHATMRFGDRFVYAFAGGLDGHALDRFGVLAEQGAAFDAEGRLRGDEPGGGRLDLDRVWEYLRTWRRLGAPVECLQPDVIPSPVRP